MPGSVLPTHIVQEQRDTGCFQQLWARYKKIGCECYYIQKASIKLSNSLIYKPPSQRKYPDISGVVGHICHIFGQQLARYLKFPITAPLFWYGHDGIPCTRCYLSYPSSCRRGASLLSLLSRRGRGGGQLRDLAMLTCCCLWKVSESVPLRHPLWRSESVVAGDR